MTEEIFFILTINCGVYKFSLKKNYSCLSLIGVSFNDERHSNSKKNFYTVLNFNDYDTNYTY